MSHEVETMAYVARKDVDPPWHGLGERLEAAPTPEEMLKAAGLDWRVELHPVYFCNDREPGHLMCVPGYRAIVRSSDRRVLAVLSERYHPVQNAELLAFFKDFCAAGGMEMETAGSLRRGAIVWALARLKSQFTLRDEDEVKAYLLLANSHDGSLCFQARLTSIRVVCWNTLMAALGRGPIGARSFAMRHTRRFTQEVEAEAREALGLAIGQFERLQNCAQTLSQARAEPHLVLRYLLELTEPKLVAYIRLALRAGQKLSTQQLEQAHENAGATRRFWDLCARWEDHGLRPDHLRLAARNIWELVETAPGATLASSRQTWWGVVNAVTYYTDHHAGRDADRRLTSAWFGPGSQLKLRALHLAGAYATEVASEASN